MSAHTEGPWLTTKSCPVRRQPFAIAQVRAANLIAGVFDDVSGGESVAEANAHLIAAAPELLASCKELREALAAAMRAIATCNGADAFISEIKSAGVPNGVGVRADAIIAKAEGRS